MSPSAHKPVELIDWSLLALLDHHGPCALKELVSEADSNIDIGEKSQSLNKEVCSITVTRPVINDGTGGGCLRGDAGTTTERW